MRMPRFALLLLLLAGAAGVAAVGSSAGVRSSSSAGTDALGIRSLPPRPAGRVVRATAEEGSGRAVRFEANEGQAPAGVRYVARGSGRVIVFDDTGLAVRAGGEVVRIGFAASHARPRAELRSGVPGVSNYLRGNDRRQWVTGVEGFRRLTYESVAPGIDAQFYADRDGGDELELDFVVAPGASVDDIVLEVEGAADVAIVDDGALRIATSEAQITLRAPVSYQDVDGGTSPVESSYRLLGERRVGFEIGAYDARQPLVIDPVLVYSTFLGGAGSSTGFGDFGFGVASDAGGNAYIVGSTDSASFPSTPGAYQPACAGIECADGFITKLDPSGALVFSTFIGGAMGDGIQDVQVSATTGAIHFVGAGSDGFPLTAGAFQSVNAGSGDVVVGALDPTGSMLLASTFLGGSGSEGTVELAIDGAGDMYVTGQTVSCDLPTTAGAFQAVDPTCGLFDAFVAKISADATAAHYVTYLGGATGSDVGFGIDVDASGHAYVVGFAGSTDFPTTAGSLQPVWPGGFNTAWVSKLLPDGSGLVYSTFLGGSESDSARSVAVDADGNAYVVGTTASLDFPTVNPVQAALAGGTDAFLSVLDASGAALLSSSYLGGSGADGGAGGFFDAPGIIWFTGSTSSADFPLVDALQAANAGGRDVFVVRFDTTAPALAFSTYIGGVDDDTGRDIAAAPGGAVGTGFTASVDFPTVDPAQPAHGGGAQDAMAFRIGPAAIEVTVSGPRRVNPRSRGVIPVAILTTAAFDATTVDPASASFGPAMAPIAHRGHIGDVDGDGDDDLQVHFRTRATGIACGDTEALLTATTFAGTSVSATVPITTVGCR